MVKVTTPDNVINKALTGIKGQKVQMAFELDGFNKYRWWSDGVDIINTSFTYDNKGDHTPRLVLFIGIFNFKLIEMSVYNIFHDEVEEDDIKED